MECHTSTLKLLGLLGLTCVMVGASYFCTTLPDLMPRVVGWIGVGFFSLGFIAAPIMIARAGPQVVISDEGIEGPATRGRRHRVAGCPFAVDWLGEIDEILMRRAGRPREVSVPPVAVEAAAGGRKRGTGVFGCGD